ncbi:hypothetical protein [Streptomyces rapamycinicus]|uniref:Uncharacterized protein n=2 Tax=Streptomyces rapamycinicus TaxID=1226757 RepID=A0A0A0N782_STRRN|nr:hypothetical protein [Streptomyces rapamycinicus]AGP51828.1 hypothetical protein M271_00955 [Streptomyces rapamycinicus NRRL 5491]MBB4779246.1 hypothetical protein [Streptomyces rapamycinicus]RLV76091.1 hypothetical protein D3C57_142735 [Streptomyces rapamycinicus NRRL 5491]UTP28043.1 hypothetical protein LIV37_00835 [Streptomyces rapamycinicus NRRL 5491]
MMSTGTSVDISPADALDGTSTERALAGAKHAFTDRIHELRHAGLGDEWATSPLSPDTSTARPLPLDTEPTDDAIISLHMAALAHVLASSTTTSPATTTPWMCYSHTR